MFVIRNYNKNNSPKSFHYSPLPFIKTHRKKNFIPQSKILCLNIEIEFQKNIQIHSYLNQKNKINKYKKNLSIAQEKKVIFDCAPRIHNKKKRLSRVWVIPLKTFLQVGLKYNLQSTKGRTKKKSSTEKKVQFFQAPSGLLKFS